MDISEKSASASGKSVKIFSFSEAEVRAADEMTGRAGTRMTEEYAAFLKRKRAPYANANISDGAPKTQASVWTLPLIKRR